MKSTFTLLSAMLIGLTSFGQNKQAPISFSKSDLTPIEFEAPQFNPESARSIEQLTRMGHEAPARPDRSTYVGTKNSSEVLSTTRIPLELFNRAGGSPCNLEEGFETSVPPPGWTLNQLNVAQTWYQDDGQVTVPTEGTHSAMCEYDPALNFQLEQLQSGAVNLSTLVNPTLSFDWLASYYWGVDPNDNYDLNVYISTNGGANWIFLWNEDSEGVFTSFQWYTKVLDLSAYGSATAALFRFEYFGADGAQANLDAISVCGIIPGAPCTTAANTYSDLNTAGGAPCFDGVQCLTTDPDFTTGGFGVYGSEAYLLENVEAGFDYIFDMCTGFGAGAWIPEITIVAADGTTIDAENTASGSSGLTHGQQCSLSWTASQSGTYTIFINEMGTAAGNAPSQLNCFTTLAVDNGNPTVTCGANPAPCPPCEAGMFSSATTQGVCPGQTLDLTLTGNTSPDTYTVGFAPGAGASGGNPLGFSVTGYDAVDFPLSLDNDLNGILSANLADTLLGTWTITVYAVNSGFNCDSTSNTITVTFYTANDPACITAVNEAEEVSFNLYPNPNSGEFFIDAQNVNSEAVVNVVDMAGKLIYTETVQMSAGFRKSYDLDVAAGSYLVQLLTSESVITRKLTVE